MKELLSAVHLAKRKRACAVFPATSVPTHRHMRQNQSSICLLRFPSCTHYTSCTTSRGHSLHCSTDHTTCKRQVLLLEVAIYQWIQEYWLFLVERVDMKRSRCVRDLSRFNEKQSPDIIIPEKKLFGFSCFESSVNLKQVLLHQALKKNFSSDDISFHIPNLDNCLLIESAIEAMDSLTCHATPRKRRSLGSTPSTFA